MKKLKIALVFAGFVVAATLAAQAQQDLQVFVSGTTNGGFGNPIDQAVPLVPAITLNGPGTIGVTYVSGFVTVNNGGPGIGPDGVRGNIGDALQTPLQEAHAVANGWVGNIGALFGVFVPQPRVAHAGFSAIDGTKNLTRVGIKPGELSFVGEGNTFEAKGAGTLFLGVNDMLVGDNGGGFTVEVTGP